MVMTRALFVALLLSSSVAVAAPRRAPVHRVAPPLIRHGPLHHEFGERELGGQAARGVVTLLQRRDPEVRSLLTLRTSFRDDINLTVR